MKPEPIIDRYGDIISFKILNLNFISLDDAIKFKKYFEETIGQLHEEIKTYYYQIGFPRFVNIEKMLQSKLHKLFFMKMMKYNGK